MKVYQILFWWYYKLVPEFFHQWPPLRSIGLLSQNYMHLKGMYDAQCKTNRDMTDETRLNGYAALYRSFDMMVREKHLDERVWTKYSFEQLELRKTEMWCEMYLLIPVEHFEDIDMILTQSKISHHE